MMDGLLEGAASVLMAIGVGIASALVPVVNAEAAAGAAGLKLSLWLAVSVSIALAVGQTAGKLFLFEAKIGMQLLHPNLIRVHDSYGRELYITREHWRDSVLLKRASTSSSFTRRSSTSW